MNTKSLVRTGLLLALALIFQIGFRQFAQPLVGPLVNMTLILATLIVGVGSGVFIGIITPIVAFMMGIIGLAPLIPIICVGNASLVIAFSLMNNTISMKGKRWISIVVAAFIKFFILAIAVRTVLPLFIPKVPPAIIAAFSLPQLYTAIIGGVVALLIYPLIQKGIE